MTKVSGIYRIRNLMTGKAYIGSSVSIERRFNEHRRRLSAGSHHSTHLQRAWDKDGKESFIFEILENVEPVHLIKKEQEYLDRQDGEHLYNTCLVAYSHLGTKRSAETKAKMRLSAKTRKRPPPQSEETRRKKSVASKGRKMSPEAVAKMSAVNKGKKLDAEHIEKIRAAKLGYSWGNHTEEAKERMRQTIKNKKLKRNAEGKFSK